MEVSMRIHLVVCVMLAFGLPALAADLGLFGTKVAIHERPGRTPRSDLRCRDAAVALPAPGAPGDPSVGGVDIEISVPNGGGVPVAVPGGTGWTIKSSSPPYYLYKNASAPQGGSAVRKLLLRGGKLVKLQMRGAPVGAASPSGGVDVRLELANGDRLCASFSPGDVVKDQPGTLIGRNAVAPADCGTTTSTTVVTTSTTPTTIVLSPCFTGPGGACDNDCPGGTCMAVPTFSNPQLTECLCVPVTVVPCGNNASYPTCGEPCASGETCAPFVFDSTGSSAIRFCACVASSAVCAPAGPSCSPGVCSDGLVCTDDQGDPRFCGCGPAF
jgi:hypothetical protein